MKIKFYFNSPIFSLPLLNKALAVTICPCAIFFREEREKVSPRTIRHELIHVYQMRKHGLLKFYYLYLYNYIKNYIKYKDHYKAYAYIPFEIEARLKSLSTEAFVSLDT